jgi:hypothetical protein
LLALARRVDNRKRMDGKGELRTKGKGKMGKFSPAHLESFGYGMGELA